jgi:Resolvase, N terminal domain
MAKRSGEPIQAVAYLRTSSATNIGADKDSDKRQRDAIAGFARRAGFTIVDEFYDAAVSGADPIDQRPGFTAMLKRIEGNGVRTILVETAHRFARDLMGSGGRLRDAEGVRHPTRTVAEPSWCQKRSFQPSRRDRTCTIGSRPA